MKISSCWRSQGFRFFSFKKNIKSFDPLPEMNNTSNGNKTAERESKDKASNVGTVGHSYHLQKNKHFLTVLRDILSPIQKTKRDNDAYELEKQDLDQRILTT